MTDTPQHISTLMMIDDSDVDQMIYAYVASRSGIVGDVVQFTDATLALAHLSDEANAKPQLILLDINMPPMDGFGFLEAAQAQLGADMCPDVVMLTSSMDQRDHERAEAFKMVRDFLNKPLTVENILAISQLIVADAS